ncbi:hypothetical protein GCM10009804_17370 [Kribbella hippodromi]|uniref:4-hydroxy-3-methylbut-2-enyl diphosphate reductase n=1 Tax=Kribbella hippodromi TaxID=434347 RepID=A0ABN2CQN8_9ACTN
MHQEARKYAAAGHTVVLIGHAGHEEVEGTLGEAPGQTVLVEDLQDVDNLQVDDPTRVSYLTQTTLAVDETTALIDALRNKFPGARGPDTADICYATTNRQAAVSEIAEHAQLIIVVGSANSSNSRRLVEIAIRSGTPAYLVDNADEVDPDWLNAVSVVGLTAGASAPPVLVDEVIARLGEFGPVEVVEYTVTRETIRFTLPPEVRRP